MVKKDRNYNPLVDYLEKRDISPKEAIDIIQASTPEGKEDNQKFNWKMFRFTLFVWERELQHKNGNLLSKTETAKQVVNSTKYRNLYEPFNPGRRFDPVKEAKNLFKLVTDPRQRPYFKSRYFVYEGSKPGQTAKWTKEKMKFDRRIPQEHIDYLMQFPKETS